MERETIEDITNTSQTRPHSYLFMGRMWAEELGNGQWEWRGQVQHVLRGEIHYFREWMTLVEVMAALLPDPTQYDSSGCPNTMTPKTPQPRVEGVSLSGSSTVITNVPDKEV